MVDKDKTNLLGKHGITVGDEEVWIFIIRAIELDKSRPVRTYTHKQISKIAKVSKSVLNNLVQTRVIIPYKEERGRGGRSTYDYSNLIEVMFCREMRKFSIGLHIIKDQLTWLRNRLWRFQFYAHFFADTEFSEEALRLIFPGDVPLNKKEIEKRIRYRDYLCWIERSHTVWDFLRIYPYEVARFYFIWGTTTEDEQKANEGQLYEEHDVIGGIKNIVGSVVINLSELKREIDRFENVKKSEA